jgi:hypothetical protein
MAVSSSATKLKEMINKAIEDHEITVSEYERIQFLASADNVVDAQEKALLQSLQSMIENGIVKRVPDPK